MRSAPDEARHTQAWEINYMARVRGSRALRLPGRSGASTGDITGLSAASAVMEIDALDTATIPATRDEPAPPLRLFTSRRRRVRLRFGVTLVALVLVVVVNLFLQLNRRYWDLQSDTYYSLHRVQLCESLGRSPDVLFLGSSRVVYGVDPGWVSTMLHDTTGKSPLGCNAGIFGSTFEQDYYTFKRLVKDGYTPKVLVEDLREYNLNSGAIKPADTTGSPFTAFLSVTDLSDAPALAQHFENMPVRGVTTGDYILGKVLPMYGDRAGIYHTLCGHATIGPCAFQFPGSDPLGLARYQMADRYGWVSLADRSMGSFTPQELAAFQVRVRPYYAPEVEHFAIGGHQADFLAKLIALARAHGTRVALVVSPLHPWFFTYFDHPTDWDMIAAYWQAFGREHDVPVFDASHLPNMTDNDWWDPEHLSMAGAIHYSTWLAETVVGPLLS